MNDASELPDRKTDELTENQERPAPFGLASGRPRMVDRRKPERRALFLAQISKTLFESLDYEQTLQTVAKLAMPELGAWCIVDIIDSEGSIRRLAVYHPRPQLRPVARELAQSYPPREGDLFGAPRILSTQQPELVPEVTPAMLEKASHDKRHLELLRTLGLCTYMVVPLKARNRLLGAMTFVGADSDSRYAPRDLLFAEDLAGRAAMAMDNARLFLEAKLAKEEAIEAVGRAAIADRAKTDFLATMSHELRTPLNAIAGYAELLELGMRGPISEQQREAIVRIRRSQQHLLGIVNDILTFAKTETGRIPINPEDTPLGPVIAAVHFLVEPLLTEYDIRLNVVDCGSDVSVLADRERVQHILVNLLSNAAKFSKRGESVTVRCEKLDHLVAIRIEDRGKGIESGMLEAIFEPFVQISTGLTRTADGSGLGLSISRELARLMGGDVTVESTAGEGSTFTLTLPLSAPNVSVM